MTKQILRMSDVVIKTKQSRSNIYLLMDKKLFPQSIKISERSIGWLESDIDGWIDDKVKSGRENV